MVGSYINRNVAMVLVTVGSVVLLLVSVIVRIAVNRMLIY